MNGYRWLLSLSLVICTTSPEAQPKEKTFPDIFNEEKIIPVTITTDIRNLLAEKKSLREVDAVISCKFSDSSLIEDNIRVRPRGHFRRENCYLSSLMLVFNNNPSNKLASLKNLKMVGGCGRTSSDEQFLLKEYLLYKMYNYITDLSFRVRLLHVTFVDSKKKMKSFSQYSFLLEDVDAVAKRNQLQQKKRIPFSGRDTDRHQTTLMCMFQYMIGNTDWSIPNYHNIRLAVPKTDTNSLPLPIPYDFDMTGAVNPPYAGPAPIFEIEKVTDRMYRGFPVSGPELDKLVDVFLQKEKHIMYLIQSFELLDRSHKNEMLSFINDFFVVLKNKSSVVNVFIRNARQ